MGRTPEDPDRILRYEKEVAELQGQVRFLEEEVAHLRRRLQEQPRQIQMLQQKLAETREQLARTLEQNEKLAATLREAREQLTALKEEVEKLTAPPSGYGVFLDANEDGTVNVLTAGRKMRVALHPAIDPSSLAYGQEVILNEAMVVVGVKGFENQGEVVTLKDLLSPDRAIVVTGVDEERVARLAQPLRGVPLRAGDSLLYDPKSGYVLERLPKPEVDELVLEEIPDVTYDDIGGLAEQIEAIRDAVELPYLHANLFEEHRLKPPKGVLLYGPPGCGKTLIAKAVANSLARRVAEATGNSEARSYFLNVKGPELLNKYVGETERHIRLIFQRAKEKSREGFPVIVFFDEMDSIFRTRGTGISSDVETTIVPQLLAEIDGVESLRNVVVIGASNREDLIDPAILRPGRLDVKIKIDRPDKEAAKDIFSKYLKPDLPIHPEELEKHGGDPVKAVGAMIDEIVERMYEASEENRFLEVTYASGDKEVLYFRDFNSGAMIESIVSRAKKKAIKRFLATGEKGIKLQDLVEAYKEEFRENEDLPNTTNPDDWARVSGKKGERIVYVRTLMGASREASRAVERVPTGQYL